MPLRIILYAAILCHVPRTVTCQELDCLPEDRCSCKFTDGRGIVDLTSLGYTDNTPRFKDVLGKDKFYYSYNPCGGFNEGQCSDAAACVMTSDKQEQEQIGDAKPILFKYDKGHVVAGYTSGSGVLFLTQVTLECDETACDPAFTPMGQSLRSYEMTMKTVCACPGMCDKNGPKNCKSTGSSTLSGGVIVIIVAFSMAILYMIGGAVYMKIRNKATGKDLIVHRDLFKSLPSLIKSGFLFTFGKCLPKRCVETYDTK